MPANLRLLIQEGATTYPALSGVSPDGGMSCVRGSRMLAMKEEAPTPPTFKMERKALWLEDQGFPGS